MTLHGTRQAVWVRLATRRGDVVRLVCREEESVGGRGISEKKVCGGGRRWQIGVVARGAALRIAAALSTRSVDVINNSNNSNVGRLRVQTGVDERHLLEYKN
jgi:hypothetical protein